MPTDGRFSYAEKMDYSSPESTLVVVVVSLVFILVWAIVTRGRDD